MHVGSKGNIITEIVAIEQSVYAEGYVAFKDSDGAIVQIKKSEIKKLNNYIDDKSPANVINNQQVMPELEITDYFMKKQ
jgi:hypothetical protein